MKINRELMLKFLIGGVVLTLLLNLLPWDIPFLRILITLAVAYVAFTMPIGEGTSKAGHIGLSVHTDESPDGKRRTHNCAFARSTLDLTDSGRLPDQVRVNLSFGSTTVRLPVDAGITVQANCAFGSVTIPDHPCVLFGSSAFQLGSQDPNAPRLHIAVNCSFGSVNFIMG